MLSPPAEPKLYGKSGVIMMLGATQVRQLWLLTVTALVLAGLALHAAADNITLTNGNTIEGVVVSETSNSVVIETAAGQLRLPLARIESIDRGAPWGIFVTRAQEAQNRGQWETALEAYDMALEMMDAEGVPVDDEERADLLQHREECTARMQADSVQLFSEVLEDADELVARRRFDEAVTLIDEAISQAPPDLGTGFLNHRAAEILIAQAEHQRDMVQTVQAMSSLQAAVDRDPTNVVALQRLGKLLAERNPSNPDAVNYLTNALNLMDEDDDSPEMVNDTIYTLARCLQVQGRYLEASGRFTEVNDRTQGRHPRANQLAVNCLISWAGETPFTEENSSVLVERLTRAHTLAPGRIEPLNMLGDLLRDRGRIVEAREYYLQSLSIERSQPLIHLRLAEIYRSLDDLQAAERSLQDALATDPNLYPALCERGEIYEVRGEFEVAMGFVDQAIEVNGRLVRAHTIRARILRKLERLDEAKEELRTAISLQSNNIEPYLEMGRILVIEQDITQAQVNFNRVIELVDSGDFVSNEDPDWIRAQCHIGLGRIHLDRNQINQALEQFNLALELAPEDADTYAALGEAYEAKDQLDDAAHAYERAIELDPEEPDNHYRLALLYHYRLRDHDRAVEHYRRYLELGGPDVAAVTQLLSDLGVR